MPAPRSQSPSYATARYVERALPIGILLLSLVSVPILVFQPEGLPRLRALEKEMKDVTTQNAELRRDVKKLRIEVTRLKDDPTAVERIARDKLGLVRRSEVVFQFGAKRD